MNILLVCNKSPWPPKDGSSSATLSMAKALFANGAKVSILAMKTSKHPVIKESIPESLTSKVDFHFVNMDTRTRVMPALLDFFVPGTPYIAKRFLSEEFRQTLREIIRKNDFDIIQFEGLYALQYHKYLEKQKNFKIAYRAHNAEFQIWQGMACNSRNIFRKIYFRRLSSKLEKFEKRHINQYDFLVPISETDLHTFQTLGNTKPFLVAPYGIFPEDIPNPGKAVNNNLFFIGALDWLPNREGIKWFVNEVWPGLRKKFPALTFRIAGRNMPGYFLGVLNKPGIFYDGEVEDAGRFMQENGIMVVPLFSGSGMRVKIIDAMAHHRPVIATPIAAKGIPATNSENILIAANSMEFISAIEKMLSDDAFRNRIAENAGLFALTNFNNFDMAKTLIQFYKAQS
jgi:polysaccharide biosynthesis protein PslH